MFFKTKHLGQIFVLIEQSTIKNYVLKIMLNKPQKTLKDESVCQERLQHLANIALDVVESIVTDMEAPITLRLNAAFRIFELCNKPTQDTDDIGHAIVRGIEKNANELAYIESLMKAKEVNQVPTTTIDVDP